MKDDGIIRLIVDHRQVCNRRLPNVYRSYEDSHCRSRRIVRSIRKNRSTWIDQRNAKWVSAWTRVSAFFGVRRANDNITRQATAWWQSRCDSSRPHGPSARPSNFTNTDSRVNTIKAAATPASGLMSNPSHWRNVSPRFFFFALYELSSNEKFSIENGQGLQNFLIESLIREV